MNWLKIPEGENVTIRIIETQPVHTIAPMSLEQVEAYAKAVNQCPFCAAGIPHSKGDR